MACATIWAIAQKRWLEVPMGRMDGKVAFVTGAARGQGRRHAVRLARASDEARYIAGIALLPDAGSCLK
jgi:hypothetical protein